MTLTQSNSFNLKMFFKTVLTIALPIALQNLLNTTASMVDTIMIGTQGELAVAAVGICSQINSLFVSLYFGFAGGALLFFSQYWGAKDEKGINRTFGFSLMCVLAVAVVFSAVVLISPQTLLSVYTDKINIIEMAVPYMKIVGYAYPLMVANVIISFLMRSTERVKAPLFCSIVSLVVNFCLNWLLINGNWGCPKMGPAGAAVGTLVSTAACTVLLVIFLLRDKNSIQLQPKYIFGFNPKFIGSYFKKCFPILCNEAFYGIGQMLINIVIGRQVESAIAAMAAFRVLEGFVFAFFGGLADAASVVVGKEIGAGRHMNGYRFLKGYSVLCPAITFIIVLTFIIIGEPLLSLFGLGAEAMEYCKYMLLIYLAAGTMRTCNYMMNTGFRAGGDPVFGTLLEILSLYIISVPLTWASGLIWKLPFLAVFAFVYTDELIRLVFEFFHTRSCKWIKPVTPQGVDALPEFYNELHALRHKK